MIRARILGSGTSNGVPSLAKAYSEEYLANPKNHRTRPSLLLRTPTTTVLVDCTPEMRLQLLAAKAYKLDAVILSHAHADHIMGMDDLRPFSLHTGEPVVIYAWEEVEEAVRRIYPYAFEDFPPGIFVPRFDMRRLETFHTFGDIEVEILPVMHGKMRVAGIKVGRFAYLTDVNFIPEDIWPKLQNLDILVLDAVRRRPHPHHFNLDQALEVAGQLAAKRTILTHLSDDYDHDVDNASLPPRIELGYDGLEFDIEV